MRKIKIYTLLYFMLIACGGSKAVLATGVSQNDSGHIYTIGHRTLRDTLNILGQQLQCTITYEDPQYVVADEKALFPGGPIGPIERTFEFRYDPTSGEDNLQIIKRMVDKFNRENNYAVYEVRRSKINDSIFHVVPVKSRNQMGNIVPCTSFLDPTISVNKSDRYEACMDLVCNLAKQPQKPRLSPSNSVSFNFQNTETSLIANNQSASDCMDMLISSFANRKLGKLSWYIACDTSVDFESLCITDISESPDNFNNKTVIYTDTEQPLAQAIRILCKELRCSSAFEDAPWACPCEVLYDRNDHPQVPRGGILNFTYSRDLPVVDPFHDCVDAYNHQSNPGQFASYSERNFVYVYPIQSVNKDNSINNIKTHLLDTEMVPFVKSIPLSECLKNMCQQISKAAGKEVLIGSITDLPLKKKVTLRDTHKAVTFCLENISKQIGKPICWQLLYDPKNSNYRLNAFPADKPLSSY